MINDIDIFKKIQEQCSNIFLLDENLCVSKSYQIINHNIQSLSAALWSFQPTIDYFNQTYTYFTQNSSKYNEVFDNLNSKNSNLIGMCTTVQTNSAFFNGPFMVFYKTQFEVSNWNTNIVNHKNTIKTWLSENYPNKFYLKNQKIIVTVILYIEKSFNLANNKKDGKPDSTNINSGFYKELKVSCTPPVKPKVTITCTAETFGTPYAACKWQTRSSHHFRHSRHKTINAYTQCKGTIKNPTNEIQPSCASTGAKILTVSDNYPTVDRHITTMLNLTFQNRNGSWTNI